MVIKDGTRTSSPDSAELGQPVATLLQHIPQLRDGGKWFAEWQDLSSRRDLKW